MFCAHVRLLYFILCVLYFTAGLQQKPDITSRQRTYNVPVRRFRSNTVALGKQKVWQIMGVWRFTYPTCNALGPYFYLGSVRLYDIFPHYLINGTILLKKKGNLLNMECVIWFYLHLSEIFLILRNVGEIWSKTYIDLYVKYPLLLWDINGTGIFSANFPKVLEH